MEVAAAQRGGQGFVVGPHRHVALSLRVGDEHRRRDLRCDSVAGHVIGLQRLVAEGRDDHPVLYPAPTDRLDDGLQRFSARVFEGSAEDSVAGRQRRLQHALDHLVGDRETEFVRLVHEFDQPQRVSGPALINNFVEELRRAVMRGKCLHHVLEVWPARDESHPMRADISLYLIRTFKSDPVRGRSAPYRAQTLEQRRRDALGRKITERSVNVSLSRRVGDVVVGDDIQRNVLQRLRIAPNHVADVVARPPVGPVDLGQILRVLVCQVIQKRSQEAFLCVRREAFHVLVFHSAVIDRERHDLIWPQLWRER